MREIRNKERIEKFMESCGYQDNFSFPVRDITRFFSFEPGEVLLREGEQPAWLFYLVEGSTKTCLTHANGKVSIINFIHAPYFIGEMELLGAQTEANGVTALCECLCLALPAAGYRDLLLNDVRLLRALCLQLGKRASSNTRMYTRNQAYPLENRLAAFIVTTAHEGIYSERHTEAAEYLGVSYRHLLYVLAGWAKRGILEKEGRKYRIRDWAYLKKKADEML